MSPRVNALLMIAFSGALVYAGLSPRLRSPFNSPWWVPPESWDRPLRVLGLLWGVAGIVLEIGLLLGWLPAD